MTTTMDADIIEKASAWLSDEFDEQTRAEVEQLIASGGNELFESFYKELEFGTGGLRGIMGPGTNRINKYTIGMATQGLSNYLKRTFSNEKISVAIAYDCRNNSSFFAKTTAEVFSANNIEVHLFENLRPTPELSFALRELGCQSGIVITASHNPKEYNGYKVYWSDGGQLVAPHDHNVITEVRSVKGVADVNFEGKAHLIHGIGQEIDTKYLAMVKALSLFDNPLEKESLKIVYTSLHGTGITLVPEALKATGFTQVTSVAAQEIPDGNFPSVHSPNPEETAALKLAIEQSEASASDILFGTDPDADRVGIAVNNGTGKFELMNGNDTAAILVYYLLSRWKELGKFNGKEFVAKTIVTTYLLDKICASFNVKCFNTLTGFKYIAELINKYDGELQFIGGGEESYGYLIGDAVRDKDAVLSTVMIAECAAWAKSKGLNLLELLKQIHQQHGVYKEALISLTKKGKSGEDEIKQIMNNYRTNPPETINDSTVIRLMDYGNSEATDLISGKKESIDLPQSNVLQFSLADGSLVTARPSGTEPKIKFYISVNAAISESYEETISCLENRIEGIKSSLALP